MVILTSDFKHSATVFLLESSAPLSSQNPSKSNLNMPTTLYKCNIPPPPKRFWLSCCLANISAFHYQSCSILNPQPSVMPWTHQFITLNCLFKRLIWCTSQVNVWLGQAKHVDAEQHKKFYTAAVSHGVWAEKWMPGWLKKDILNFEMSLQRTWFLEKLTYNVNVINCTPVTSVWTPFF